MLDEILEHELARALRRAQISRGENPAEPAVGRAVRRIGEDIRRPVVEGEPRARNDPHAGEGRLVLAGEDMGAHDFGERIPVGDPDPGEPKFGRPRHHLLGMRGSAQKREIRRRREFREARLDADHLLLPQGASMAACLSSSLAGEGALPKQQ